MKKVKKEKNDKKENPKKEDKKALIKTKEKTDQPKEKLGTRFMNSIKKRWLISGTNTLLLIAILVAIVILINSIVQSLDLIPIDCTSNKQYTLTEESKERVANIEDNVNLYFIGFEESDGAVSLAKQYNKVNENIKVELIDTNERTDIAEKYEVTNDYTTIIVENGERSKMLYSSDLYTYDSNYNTVDVTEQKITSAILNVTADEIANIYFLTGYSDYSLDYSGGMYYLSYYLDDEVLNYDTLNILVTGSIPDDCDTLVITTPNKDFDELTTNEIIDYINNGGNILWLNASYAEAVELTNVNKILALYGINPFDVGYVYETDTNKMALGYASCIVENLGYTEIDTGLNRAVLLNSTKINVNTDSLEDLGVVEQDIITTTDTAYFRSNVANTSTSTDGDEAGSFTIGGIFTKTLADSNEEQETDSEESTQTDEENADDTEELTSTLVIFGDNNFISDIQITSQVNPMIFLENNKDLMLNSIAYLTDNDEDITIRKNYTSVSSFTATEAQKLTIMRIIFIVPIAIIFLGFVVWQVRRRKK